jgi:periplasmic iron binding protein
VLRRWLGPFLAVFIVVGVGAILLTNLETRRISRKPVPASIATDSPGQPRVSAAGFREYPIGDEQEQNHLRIRAVWLPSVEVEGMKVLAGTDVIHLEADIHATRGNPNGFGLDEFVPYLVVTYSIQPVSGGPALTGPMSPMVASDGLHYGASIRMPGPGLYRLAYHIEPPSRGGLGRHNDRITGVAPWWAPFDLSFDWEYKGIPATSGP